jgi:hypothetical protein
MVMVVLMCVKSLPYDNWRFPILPSTLKEKKKETKVRTRLVVLEGKLGEKNRVGWRTDGAQYYADQWREKVMI